MHQNEMEEKEAQKDYEELMAESANKRSEDSKKAQFELDHGAATKDHKDNSAALVALGEYISQLHGSCDFLLDNFALRQEARANEIDAMKKAKAVLNGADYSFVQVRSFLARN